MSTAVSHLPFAANAAEGEIKRVFERQRETALRLRSSSADEAPTSASPRS
jgi:aldehyde dehydrogenase (NAD+)